MSWTFTCTRDRNVPSARYGSERQVVHSEGQVTDNQVADTASGGIRSRIEHASTADFFQFIALVTLAVILLLVLISLATQRLFSIADQPFPDAHEYIDAAHRLANVLGYTTTVRDFPLSPHLAQAVNPPRFPPGTSLVLAPFALVGSFPGNVEFGSRLIVVALVLAVAWAGYSLAGIWTALIASLLVATSDFAVISTHEVMSDALSALLAVVLLPLMRIRATWSVYLCGVLAGYSVVVREGGIVVVICLLVVLSGWDRLKAGLAACVPIAGLALYNWFTFGAPWRSGQGYWLGTLKIYSPSFILKHPWLHDLTGYNGELRLFHLVEHSAHGPIGPLPNVVFYPLVALGLQRCSLRHSSASWALLLQLGGGARKQLSSRS
jgi:hypothetical protein